MFPILITTVERNPADLSARAHAECARGAWQAVGEEWQAEILGPRFQPGAQYTHRTRTSKYQRLKEHWAQTGRLIGGRPVLFGGRVVNVLTGNMAELLSRPGIVRAVASHATVRKVGPRYITMRPYKSNQPDKWAELTALNQDDRARLGKTWLETYRRLAAALREVRK